MALFQPTNVIPSSFTVGVVDAEKDIAQVSWQVNGNSPMTSYKIDFYRFDPYNASDSSLITSTGKISDGIPSGGFYGTDRFGQPQIFTWTAGGNSPKTWKEFYSAFTNGNQFRFKITQYWQEPRYEAERAQIEANVFITRSKPQISIQRSATAEYINLTPFPSGSALPASIGYFAGDYTQANGAPVREVRWQVATRENGEIGEILADTGDIDTSMLRFTFNGFFIGNQYAVRCSGKTDYQTYGTQDFDSEWVNFTAQLPEDQKQSDYTGNFTVECLPKENAALLQWEPIEVISPTTSPEDFHPVAINGSVVLTPKSSITWDNEGFGDGKKPIKFAPPWTVAINLQPKKQVKTIEIPVSGTASETIKRRYGTAGAIRRPDKDPSRVSIAPLVWQAEFTLPVQPPYATYSSWKTDYNVTLYYSSNSGQQLSSGDFTVRANDDGSVTVVTTKESVQKPIGAIIFTNQIGYRYTQEFEAPASLARLSIDSLGDETLTAGYSHNFAEKKATIILYGKYVKSGDPSVSAAVTAEYPLFYPDGKVLGIGGGNVSIGIVEKGISFFNGESKLAEIEVPTVCSSIAAVLTPGEAIVYSYFEGNNKETEIGSTPVSYSQQPITSVSVYGGDNGVTVGSVSVFQGDGSNIRNEFFSVFEPIWNSLLYSLYMTANFNGNLEGGTGTASGNGFRIYRQEIGGTVLTPIATLSSTETSLKDYGIRSRKAYKYSIYAYDSNQAFMKGVGNDTVISACFNCYSLLVCDYDSENDEYHVRKQYLFALNLSDGSVGNNNSPSLNANFTSYPTRMPSTQNYASGTLQGLIGAIYTVPALVEEIAGFKHTTKPSTLDYFDSVDLEEELYALSVTTHTLFLRDMKGHLRMVATNGAISMTQDLKKRQLSITISFPWVEIGDASDVTIIQTSDDFGWGSDEQTLDVRLAGKDKALGVYTANYPKPYVGTRFYLTGVRPETKRG